MNDHDKRFDEAQDRLFEKINNVDPTFLDRLENGDDLYMAGELAVGLIYESLSHIIPLHFTIIDFGCAEGAQAVFFRHHRRYIGVDLLGTIFPNIENAEFYPRTSTKDFIDTHLQKYEDSPIFAICSYVPPWGGHDSREMVRRTFRNLFVFYPEGGHSSWPSSA